MSFFYPYDLIYPELRDLGPLTLDQSSSWSQKEQESESDNEVSDTVLSDEFDSSYNSDETESELIELCFYEECDDTDVLLVDAANDVEMESAEKSLGESCRNNSENAMNRRQEFQDIIMIDPLASIGDRPKLSEECMLKETHEKIIQAESLPHEIHHELATSQGLYRSTKGIKMCQPTDDDITQATNEDNIQGVSQSPNVDPTLENIYEDIVSRRDNYNKFSLQYILGGGDFSRPQSDVSSQLLRDSTEESLEIRNIRPSSSNDTDVDRVPINKSQIPTNQLIMPSPILNFDQHAQTESQDITKHINQEVMHYSSVNQKLSFPNLEIFKTVTPLKIKLPLPPIDEKGLPSLSKKAESTDYIANVPHQLFAYKADEPHVIPPVQSMPRFTEETRELHDSMIECWSPRRLEENKSFKKCKNASCYNQPNLTCQKGQYACNEPSCNYRFLHKSDLDNHIIVHLRFKPFACKESGCNKSFPWFYSLGMHLLTHDTGVSLECDNPGCSKKFNSSSRLMEHQSTYIDDRLEAQMYWNGTLK